MKMNWMLHGLAFAVLVMRASASAAPPSGVLSDPDIMEEVKPRGIRFPGCELLSTRNVINDLSARTQILRGEISYLQRDAQTMYEEWQGITGAGYAPAASNTSLASGRRSLRSESASAWRLYTRVNRLVESMKTAFVELQKHESSWWKLREALQEEAEADGNVQNTVRSFDVLKKGLSRSVERVKTIDAETERLQEEFDYVQPEVYASLAKEFPAANVVPYEPWHRQYEQQRIPRPRLRYDFEDVYARYMREAHEALHTSWRNPKARAKGGPRKKDRQDGR